MSEELNVDINVDEAKSYKKQKLVALTDEAWNHLKFLAKMKGVTSKVYISRLIMNQELFVSMKSENIDVIVDEYNARIDGEGKTVSTPIVELELRKNKED